MRFFEDVRFGLRTMATSLTVTSVSMLTLAMGIGVNAAVGRDFTAADEGRGETPFQLLVSCCPQQRHSAA